MPIAYGAARRVSLPALIYPLGAALLLAWLFFAVKDLRGGKRPPHAAYADAVCFLGLAATVFFLLHLSHFTDVLLRAGGFDLRTSGLTESSFHLGIVNVLRDTYPPFFPYASGIDYSHYHMFMHLEMEMFNRLFSMDTVRLMYFYFPLLYFCLLVFVPYMFIRRLSGRRSVGVLAGLLMFGSDLSFIPGLFIGAEGYPWTLYFTTTIWSIFTLNGYLPSLFVLFLCIYHLREYFEGGGLLHLVLFSVLSYAEFGFKSSAGAAVAACALATGIFIMRRGEMEKGAHLSLAALLSGLLMAADSLLRGGLGENTLYFAPFERFNYSMAELWPDAPTGNILLFPFYALLSFGVRALGFPLVKGAFLGRPPDPTVVFLALFALLGFALPEVVFVGHIHGAINKGVWFSATALMAAWLLLAIFLSRFSGRRLIVLSALTVVLSMPSTVQFLNLRYSSDYGQVGENEMEVIRYLEAAPARSVVLHPPNTAGPSLAALAGRAAVVTSSLSFNAEIIGEEEYARRLGDALFFFDFDVPQRQVVLLNYGVDYVYAPAYFMPELDEVPALRRLLRNDDYVLYRVVGAGSPP